jgi:hypothetical protein
VAVVAATTVHASGTIGRHFRSRRRRAVVGAWVIAALAVATAGCSGTQAGTTVLTPTPAVASAPPPAPAAPSGEPSTAAADPTGAPEVNPAGDIPDNQVFVPFTTPDNALVVSVPEGWARTADAAATMFTDKFNSVRIEVADRATAADVASARATEVPQLQASVPGFVLQDVRSVQRKGGTAVLITYQADSPVNPVTGRRVREAVERYAFWRAGREAVLTLAGPVGADNVDPWRIVSDSLRWQA